MKKIYALIIAGAISAAALAQSQGPQNPAQAGNFPSPIGRTWTNPTNCFTSDGMYATAAPLNTNPNCSGITCFYSVGLLAGSFGFTVPANATINGIVAEVQRWAINGPNSVFDSTIRIIKGGTVTGPNKANMVTWSGNSPAYQTYGSPTDLWGTTWTPTDINGPAFGLWVSAYNTSTTMQPAAMVDHIRMTVYYTLPVGVQMSQTSSPMTVNVQQPTTDEMHISFSTGTGQGGIIEVCNLLGGVCYRSEVKESQGVKEIITSDLKPGIYFVRLLSGQMAETRKVVIVH